MSAGGSDSRIDYSAARVVDEARETINQQLTHNQSQDTKGVWLFRTNMVVFGLLVTAVSLITSTDAANVIDYLNIWSISAIIFLLGSTFSAAFAYSSSSYQMGIGQEFLAEAIDGEYGDADIDEELQQLYKSILENNLKVGEFNAYSITIAIIAAFNSIVLFLGAGIIGSFTLSLTWISFVLLVLTAVVLRFVDLTIYEAEDYFETLYYDG